MFVRITESQLKYLLESEASPFTTEILFNKKYKDPYFKYKFNVQGLNYILYIYPNPYEKYYYDIIFTTEKGTTEERIGKDLNFLNSVLKTVANCMIDFIDRHEKIKILSFETNFSDKIREKTYVRFLRNHPYFSKFKIDDSHNKTSFSEIIINKGIDYYD